MKRFLKCALALSVASILAFSAVGCDLFSVTTKNGVEIKKNAAPKEFFEAVIENTEKEYIGDKFDVYEKLLKNVFEQGTIKGTVSLGDLGLMGEIQSEDIDDQSINVEVAYKGGYAYSSSKISGIAGDGTEIALDIFSDRDAKEVALKYALSIAGTELNGAYGLTLDNIKEKFDSSALAKFLDEDKKNEVVSAIEKGEKLSKDIQEKYKDTFEKFEEIFEKNKEKSIYNYEKINNDDKTFTINVKVKGSEYKEFILNFAREIADVPLIKDAASGEFQKLFGEESDFEPIDIVKELEDSLIEEDWIRNDEERTEVFHVTADYLIDKVETEDYTVTLEHIDGGAEIKADFKYKDSEDKTSSADFKLYEKDGVVGADAYVKLDKAKVGTEITKLALTWAKGVDGAFTLDGSIKGPEDSDTKFNFKGKLELTETTFDLVIDSVEYGDLKEDIGLKISYDHELGDSLKDKFEYKNIFELTEAEIATMAQVIGGFIGGDEEDEFEWEYGEYAPDPEFGDPDIIEGYMSFDMLYYFDVDREDIDEYAKSLIELGFKEVDMTEEFASLYVKRAVGYVKGEEFWINITEVLDEGETYFVLEPCAADTYFPENYFPVPYFEFCITSRFYDEKTDTLKYGFHDVYLDEVEEYLDDLHAAGFKVEDWSDEFPAADKYYYVAESKKYYVNVSVYKDENTVIDADIGAEESYTVVLIYGAK